MWNYPSIDPVALALGPIQIHWYGLMYLLAFGGGWLYGVIRSKRRPPWNSEMVGDLLFYVAMGVILGGRIGYILFYDLSHYLAEPMAMFRVWEGGMSFHGGLLGVTIAMVLFARKTQQSLFQVADFVSPLIPIGLLTGRIGNFINGELWGKVTDSPLGMAVYDPHLQATVSKYPTQLLEALLEGVVLFIVLAVYARKSRPAGSVAGVFLIGYGIFRFTVEFWRVPDAQLGYLLWGWVTMGQILSLPMVLFGAGLVYWAYNRKQPVQSAVV
ncbi:prolipoprotein diacylglyceryl transferase [Thiomicrorhabdus sp.]|uniref:prolipoprotein diacylglyceryl transferase n=1 Tax=Thiomicrorhabdus sp. TaxID=2039724 RepID=UPI0029C7F1CC|nr:prolipoprotein diacylglyceryl transferase [Thiomicrorhabdus sp.]